MPSVSPTIVMSEWLVGLRQSPVAHAIAVLSLVALTGIALGSVKVRGVGLGVAGVLFTGILAGHFGQSIDHKVLEFTKEFGLVLFVFTIGLQLGPGFFSSLRRQGLSLNLLAVAIVVLGAGMAAAASALLGINDCMVPGLLSGATTNTPSLAAGQQSLAALPNIAEECAARSALAYAVAYPIGIVGVIGSMLLLKTLLRIDLKDDAKRVHAATQAAAALPLERRTLVIENSSLDGVAAGEIPSLRETGVSVSRIRPAGARDVVVATRTTVLHLGDSLLAIGTRDALDRFERIVGRGSDENLLEAPGSIISRRILVTNRETLGKTVPELGLDHLFGVVVSRITRSELEMTAVPELRLKFGDVLQVIGSPDAVDKAAAHLGNSLRALNEVHFIPLFTGILIGILVGLIPIALPGLPTPLRLGLAGGPLIVAILVGRIGRIGPLVWHMPMTANLAFRELGIVLFLSCVGLTAGSRFFEMVYSREGALCLLAAVCVAVAPLMIVGAVGRVWLKLNCFALFGLLAGSMTDPPALAFANSIARSDAPSVAYATVYPLTMVLRILVAQLLVLGLFN